MAGKLFIGNTNNTASSPKQILFGNQDNIAKSVSSIFIGNSSNLAVKVWNKSGGGGGEDIPDYLQRVEYVRSIYNCNQFSRNLTCNNATRLVMQFKFISIDFNEFLQRDTSKTSPIAAPFYIGQGSLVNPSNDTTGYSFFLTSRKTGDSGIDYYFRVCFGKSENSYYNVFYYHSPNTTYNEEEVMENIGNKILNIPMKIDLNRNSGSLYINNVLTHTFENIAAFTYTNVIYFLRYDQETNPGVTGGPAIQETSNQINFYNCQIYNSDNLIYNLLPVCYKTTGKGVLYDIVNKKIVAPSNQTNYPVYVGPKIS